MALEYRTRPFHTAQLAPLSIAVLVSGLVSGLLAACSSRIPARVEIVDGRQVEIATAGSGGAATVVFEAGLCDDWTHWDEVASEVSRHTRIFAYSRPGYGASGPATTPRDPRTIVEELRALLASQGYPPPYVLVGHSNGGAYMELFAKSHADEVFRLGRSGWIRPGVSFVRGIDARGFDAPLLTAQATGVQVDVPVTF